MAEDRIWNTTEHNKNHKRTINDALEDAIKHYKTLEEREGTT